MQRAVPICDRCGRVARFCFITRGTPALRCWRHAVCYRPVFRRALEVAAVVGTITFLINQLDVVLSGKVTALVVLKIVAAYLIPFLASAYSAVEINRLHQPALAPGNAPPATPGAAA